MALEDDMAVALENLQRHPLKVKGKGKLLRLYKNILRDIRATNHKQAMGHSEELIQIIKLFPEDGPDKELSRLRHEIMMGFNHTLESIRGVYLSDEDVWLGHFVDGYVEFERGEEDYPGFYADDGKKGKRKCLIRFRNDLKKGDTEKAWITKIEEEGRLIYLEPRLETDDIIYVMVKDLGKSNDPHFIFMKYNGYFKDYGDMRIEAHKYYESKITYQRLDSKRARGSLEAPFIGFAFAQPLKEISEEECRLRKNEIIRKDCEKVDDNDRR